MSRTPLALIVGVGEATGRAVCERLAGRYRLAMVARSTATIDALAAALPDSRAWQCDVTDRAAWRATLEQILEAQGCPDRVLVNTEGGGWGGYRDIEVERFAGSFEVNVVSLFQLVQVLYSDLGEITDARIVISSSPAAYESRAMFLGIGPSRAAQRVLAETLHGMLASDGLSFAVLNIDGAIDEPGMRKAYPDQPDGFFIPPAAIAEEVAALFEAAEPRATARVTA